MNTKFRVWDTKLKKFIKNASNFFLDFSGESFFISGDSIFEVKEKLHCGFPRYILTFYSGIKDKNGVEIFEDDIVRATRVDDCYGRMEDVKTVKVTMNKSTNLDIYYCGVDDGKIWYEDIEVIGNIYDNPPIVLDLD